MVIRYCRPASMILRNSLLSTISFRPIRTHSIRPALKSSLSVQWLRRRIRAASSSVTSGSSTEVIVLDIFSSVTFTFEVLTSFPLCGSRCPSCAAMLRLVIGPNSRRHNTRAQHPPPSDKIGLGDACEWMSDGCFARDQPMQQGRNRRTSWRISFHSPSWHAAGRLIWEVHVYFRHTLLHV